MSYIIAHPGTLIEFDSIEDAYARAEAFRDERAVLVYRIDKVAHVFPRGPAAPEPKPPGTPVEAGEEKAA